MTSRATTRPLTRPMASALTRRLRSGVSPAALFAAGEIGFWLDPSDLTTLFQDTAGTTPVTTPGQTVALALDKSRGLVLGPELVTNGAFDTGMVGWSNIGSATSSSLSGRAFVTVPSANEGIRQSLTHSAGKTYIVTATVERGTAASVRVVLENFTGTPLATVTGSGPQTVTFVGSDTDANGFIRVDSSVGTFFVDNISVKELPGFHATQSTAAARPIYGRHPFGGRRNLLTPSQPSTSTSGIWQLQSATAVLNGEAVTITATATTESGYRTTPGLTVNTQYTVSAEFQYSTSRYALIRSIASNHNAWFDLQTGTLGTVDAGATATITPLSDGFYRCTITFTTGGTIANNFVDFRHSVSNGVLGVTSGQSIIIRRPQLEVGSTATPYQRVTTQFDVTEAGVPDVHYLFHGGASDPRWMITPTITPGTDKVQVFAGARKLSDAGYGVIAEPSTNYDANTGVFSVGGGDGGNMVFASKGTASSVASVIARAPITNVLTGFGDISGDRATLRLNGTQVAQVTTDQGTGNYLAYPLYIGMRGGASLPFNGHNYGLIVRFGANLDPSVIAQTERWMAARTGIVI